MPDLRFSLDVYRKEAMKSKKYQIFLILASSHERRSLAYKEEKVSHKSKIFNILAFVVMISMTATTVGAQPPPANVTDVGTSALALSPPDPELEALLEDIPDQEPETTTTPAAPLADAIAGPIVGEAIVPFSFDGSLWDFDTTYAALNGALGAEVDFVQAPAPMEAKGPEPSGATGANVQNWHPEDPMPATIVDFLGNTNRDQVDGYRHAPPDSDGDVGPNHYVQMVNDVHRVYFKDGTPASPFFQIGWLWPDGDPCSMWDDGDPIVVHDPIADRWLLTEFHIQNREAGHPFFECVAVSKTSDPVDGGWWLYTVMTHPTDFWDYPKISVWPDAYYLTGNLFLGDPPAYARAMALDRTAMLAGRPARTVAFDALDDTSLLPADVLGDAPPAGSPGYLLSALATGEALRLYTFDVDWDMPENSTMTSTDVDVDDWTGIGGNLVPQLGTTTLLDTLSDRLMFPLHYRRIGEVESLWVNHTVSGTVGASVRWYEIRDPSGTPFAYQQGTYAPDDDWRWMGSVASDREGNMAIGYSVSSENMYPAIRYAGRLVTDTLNVLGQDEVTMTVGMGSQVGWDLSRPVSRWGDYTAMSVDPVDDCTFWYTNEYYQSQVDGDGAYWSMRIGAFKFDSCDPLPATGWITGTVYDSVSMMPLGYTPFVAVNSDGTRVYDGATDGSGDFSVAVLPGTYMVSAGPLPEYPEPGYVMSVTVTSAMTTGVAIGLDPYPNLVEAGITLDDSAGGNGNGYPEPNERSIELWEDLENTGYATATNVTAELVALTPGVTVLTSTAAYPDVAPGATETNLTAFVFSIDGGIPCGTELEFAKIITSDERVFTITFGLDAHIPAMINTHTYVGLSVPQVFTGLASSSIVITDVYDVYDLDVTVNITYPTVRQFRLPLFGPHGAGYLLNRNGLPLDANVTDVTFDDEGLTSVGAGGPFVGGHFRPYNSLDMHDGQSISGTWTLQLWNDVTTTLGSLNSWTMTAQELVVAAGCEWPTPDLSVYDAMAAESGGNTNGDGYIDPGENSIDLDVILENLGTLAAANVSGVVTPQTAGVTMNVDTSAYPDIGVGAMQTNTIVFNFAVAETVPCGVPLDFEIAAATDDGHFVDTFSVNTGQPGPLVIAMVNDVEAGWGDWTTGGDGAATWVISDEAAHSPTHAWTESPGTDYVNGADNWIQSPAYDFSSFDTVVIDFWHMYDTEDNWDFGLVEASSDGGTTWTTVASYDGYGNDTHWISETVDLSAVLAHESSGLIRFRFTSDSNTVGDGWHIDDVAVSGIVRVCAPDPTWTKYVYVDDTMVANIDEVIAVVPTSTIVVVDMVEFVPTVNVTFTLTEEWSESLELVSYETLILPGGSATFPGMTVTLPTTNTLVWSITDLPSDWGYVITKTFEVATGTLKLGDVDTITEMLWVEDAIIQEDDIVLRFGPEAWYLYLPVVFKQASD
jgi:subtilisin-like proprotein convertase family protein